MLRVLLSSLLLLAVVSARSLKGVRQAQEKFKQHEISKYVEAGYSLSEAQGMYSRHLNAALEYRLCSSDLISAQYGVDMEGPKTKEELMRTIHRPLLFGDIYYSLEKMVKRLKDCKEQLRQY